MDKATFDAIFEKHQAKTFFSAEEFSKKLAPYADEDGLISAERAAMFGYVEGLKDSQDFIYSLLSELLEAK